MSSVTIGDGVKYIGALAFASLDPAIAGKEIVLPKSVEMIEWRAFENTRYGNETNHNAVALRVMNPDLQFGEAGYPGDYNERVTIDGVTYAIPFSEGQTIYAYATDSAGNPSMVKKLADAVADRKDSVDSSKPAYTFEWMGEAAQITGKLPRGAAAVLVQAGQSTPLTVSDDGSVAANVLSKTAATLHISLSGYYDMVLARPGDQMTGTWNIGEIKAEDFTKIPASRAIELNVAYLEPVAGQDKTERIELDSLDNIDLTVKSGGKTLKPAKGDKENDYRIQGAALVVSQAIADAGPGSGDNARAQRQPQAGWGDGDGEAFGRQGRYRLEALEHGDGHDQGRLPGRQPRAGVPYVRRQASRRRRHLFDGLRRRWHHAYHEGRDAAP